MKIKIQCKLCREVMETNKVGLPVVICEHIMLSHINDQDKLQEMCGEVFEVIYPPKRRSRRKIDWKGLRKAIREEKLRERRERRGV